MKNLINLKTPNEIAEKLLKEESVGIIFHIRPDGDAIGSALSLYLGLISIGVKADVLCTDDIPEKFSFLPIINKIKKGADNNYSALIAVDCGELSRLGELSEFYYRHKNTYNIDHHLSNTKFGVNNFVCTNPSNSENVYEILKALGVEFTKEIATLLFMGLMTDTGGFRHKGVLGSTYKIAGELIEYGAEPNEIYYNCFSKQTKGRAKLFGVVVSKLRYFLENRLSIASVFISDIESSGAKPSDTEGIIDFVMGIEGVEVGICLLETDKNKFKISFRGKNTDVNEIAGCFGGGGHKLASGCQIHGEYEEVIDKLHYAVKSHLRD